MENVALVLTERTEREIEMAHYHLALRLLDAYKPQSVARATVCESSHNSEVSDNPLAAPALTPEPQLVFLQRTLAAFLSTGYGDCI